jgi:hypothetical protein
MKPSKQYDPYVSPTPYEVLGIEKCLKATTREIGAAYNKLKNEARKIKDTNERAQRIKDLDDARGQLLKPDDRVLLDFFLLSEDIFKDLCVGFGDALTPGTLDTGEVLGQLSAPRRPDDLMPPLDELTAPLDAVESLELFEEYSAPPVRLSLRLPAI